MHHGEPEPLHSSHFPHGACLGGEVECFTLDGRKVRGLCLTTAGDQHLGHPTLFSTFEEDPRLSYPAKIYLLNQTLTIVWWVSGTRHEYSAPLGPLR